MTDDASRTVEFCINNVDDGARALLVESGLAVGESMCLQRCGHCYAGPFLVVDGELIEGVPHAALVRRALACRPPVGGNE
jgi:uncharacterized protein YuzB (UPF0349 family)